MKTNHEHELATYGGFDPYFTPESCALNAPSEWRKKRRFPQAFKALLFGVKYCVQSGTSSDLLNGD